MSRSPTEASFLRDVANHDITVFRDDGLYRHVRFAEPNTNNMYFDLTSWPGTLCISGDMGCYVFSRISDMFVFFRPESHERDKLAINLYYWPQKLQAVDRCGDLKEFDKELFKKEIAEWLDDAEASKSVRKAVKDEILTYVDDGYHEVMRAVYDFEHDGFRFNDFYEVDVKRYNYRFIWCCYAITWGVRKYDEHKLNSFLTSPVITETACAS